MTLPKQGHMLKKCCVRWLYKRISEEIWPFATVRYPYDLEPRSYREGVNHNNGSSALKAISFSKFILLFCQISTLLAQCECLFQVLFQVTDKASNDQLIIIWSSSIIRSIIRSVISERRKPNIYPRPNDLQKCACIPKIIVNNSKGYKIIQILNSQQ